MKKFVENLLMQCCIVLILSVLALLIGPIRIAHSGATWRLPQEKHVLFCGASAITLGINDSLTVSAVNISKRSERYMYTYVKLKRYISNNPQIDTIFIQFAPTDMWQNADDKYFMNEQLEYLPMYWSLLGQQEWKWLSKDLMHIAEVVIPRCRNRFNWSIDAYKLANGGYATEYRCFDEVRDYPKQVTSEMYNGNRINHLYCQKIIDLCDDNNIKLYFLYLPVWKQDVAYDLDYYYNTYHEKFSEVELIDYSRIEMEDCERFDAHHLNSNGARKITPMLCAEYNVR